MVKMLSMWGALIKVLVYSKLNIFKSELEVSFIT